MSVKSQRICSAFALRSETKEKEQFEIELRRVLVRVVSRSRRTHTRATNELHSHLRETQRDGVVYHHPLSAVQSQSHACRAGCVCVRAWRGACAQRRCAAATPRGACRCYCVTKRIVVVLLLLSAQSHTTTTTTTIHRHTPAVRSPTQHRVRLARRQRQADDVLWKYRLFVRQASVGGS